MEYIYILLISIILLLFIFTILILYYTCNEEEFFESDSNNNYYHFYVINLDRNRENANHILNFLRNKNWSYERVSGVDGKKHMNITKTCNEQGYDDLLCMGDEYRNTHHGATGCYLSHINCLKKIANGKYKWGIILEDDALFLDPNIDIIKLLKDNEDVDMIWLNANVDKVNEYIDGIPGCCTHGMIFKKEAARDIYHKLMPGSAYTNMYKEQHRFQDGLEKDCLYDWILTEFISDYGINCRWYSLVLQNPLQESQIDIKDDTKKLEFIHIPKNAGTAIEKAAKDVGIIWGYENEYIKDKYKNWDITDKYMCNIWHKPDNIYNTDTFAIVRNPYDRIVSNYNCKWINSDCTNDINHMNNWILNKLNDLNNDISIDDCHFIPQYIYIYRKREDTTYVLKYENNLKENFDNLMKSYNLPIRFPTTKTNEKICNLTSDDLYDETKEAIYNYYILDFIIFQYEK